MLTGKQRKLLDSLAAYRPADAAQGLLKADFGAFIADHPDCCERGRLAGHLTGSAWLVSPDGRRALLMHHRKLGRWLQPGGHADGEADLAAVALREGEEETGLSGLSVEPAIFDLDRHRIPARGAEPEHWHYDVRFVLRAAHTDFTRNEESLALAWFDMEALIEDDGMDESIRRMAHKWLDR